MQDISPQLQNAIITGIIISLPFKAVGLWRSAKNRQKGWFIALLLLNTFGILELTYLFYFSNNSKKNETIQG